MAKKESKNSIEAIEDPKVDEVQEAIAAQGKSTRPPGNWIKMDEKTLVKHQADGILVGWDPKTGEGLLKK